MTLEPDMKRLALCSSLLATLLGAGLARAGEPQPCKMAAEDCLHEMASYYRSTGWVGIMIHPNEAGEYVVTKVWAESPAAAAGFEDGDVLLAFEGLTFTKDKKAELKAAYKKSKVPGNEVTYRVRRGDRELDIELELAAVPQSLASQWIGDHMLHGHATEMRTAEAQDPP